MEKREKIIRSNCSSFTSARHISFQHSIYEKIAHFENGIAALGIEPEEMERWRGLIDLENDITRHPTASAYTRLMAEEDARRNDRISYFFRAVRAATVSPHPEQAKAAKCLLPIIRQHKMLQRAPLTEKSAYIQALVLDCKREENASAIAILGLGEALQALANSDEAYERLENARSSERVSKRLPSSKEIRPRTDQCYYHICDLIEASLLLCRDDERASAIIALIREMNALISHFKAGFRQIKAQRQAAAVQKAGATDGKTAANGTVPPLLI